MGKCLLGGRARAWTHSVQIMVFTMMTRVYPYSTAGQAG